MAVAEQPKTICKKIPHEASHLNQMSPVSKRNMEMQLGGSLFWVPTLYSMLYLHMYIGVCKEVLSSTFQV